MSSSYLFLATSRSSTAASEQAIERLKANLQTELGKRLAEANRKLENNGLVQQLERDAEVLGSQKAKYERIVAAFDRNLELIKDLRVKLDDLYGAVYNRDPASLETIVEAANDLAEDYELVFDPIVTAIPDGEALVNEGVGVSADAAAYDELATDAGRAAANAAIAAAHLKLDGIEELIKLAKNSPQGIVEANDAAIEALRKQAADVKAKARLDLQTELRKFRRTREAQINAIAASLTANPVVNTLNQLMTLQKPAKGTLLDLFS
jgi:uncharacterized protein YjaG (DUF416 family)